MTLVQPWGALMVDEASLQKIEYEWRNDLPLRLFGILITMAISSIYVPGKMPYILAGLTFTSELAQFLLFKIKRFLSHRQLWINTAANHFLGSFVFSFFGILFALRGTPECLFLAMLTLFGLVRNVAVSRSSSMILAQITLVGPFSVFLTLPAVAMNGSGSISEWFLIYFATFVFAGYMVFSLRSWHRAHTERDLALANAEQANKSKDLFLASVSHDLRTPLNGISGIAELLQTDPDNSQTKTRIEVLQKSTSALRRLADDILDFARMETGRFELAPVVSDLKAEIHSVISFYRPAAQKAGIAIAWPDIPKEPIKGLVDPVRFRQCLSNLIDNAIKYSDEGPVRVNLELGKDDKGNGLATVRVVDRGRGIAADDVTKVFDDFFHTSEAPGVGHSVTGLGLAIVKRLSNAMGGTTSVESRLGEGSCFSFSFAFEQLKNGDARAFKRLSRQRHFKDLVALVVDDVGTNNFITRSFLESKGVTVLEANSGELALEVLIKYEVDLVLLDIEMPEMDGIKTFEKIRSDPEKYGGAPVVAVTANASPHHREKYISLGMEGYISKPIEMERLFSVVHEVLSVSEEGNLALKMRDDVTDEPHILH